jgi:hypothetical protein
VRRAVLGALLAATAVSAVCVAPALGGKAASADDAATVRTLLLAGSDLPAGFVDNGVAANSGCFSPDAAEMTAKAASHQYEKASASTDTVLESSAALYRSHAAAAAVFKKLYFSKKAPTCAYARFKKSLPQKDTASDMHLIPIRTTIGTLRISVWDVSLRLSDGKRTAPVEIVTTGYLHGRALSQLLIAVVGGKAAGNFNVAKVASAAVTLKLRHAHL